MKFLPLIWAGLKRKKLRTILTLLSIFVAFLLFAFLGALKEAFNAGVTLAGADRLVVRHKVSLIQTLPEKYTARIRAIPGVVAVSHNTWFGGIYQEPKNSIATIVIVPDDFLNMYPEYTITPEEKEAWKKTRNGAIVGSASAKRFGWKVGTRVPLTAPIYGEPINGGPWEFEIVGIFNTTKKGADLTSFYFRYDFFDEARKQLKGEVGWFVVRIDNPDRAAEIAKQIDSEFANSPHETKAEPEGAFAAGFAQQIGDIATIVMAVVGAVFFTILLVAGNTMAQSVRERTEELGVLKALGFSNGLVLVFVLVESCFITVLGGLAGLGMALLMTAGGSPMPTMLPIFFVPPRDLIIGGILTLVLGLAAGILPAWQAMRLQIAEALRKGG
jgi:putative ABC transport system permease protein